MGAEMGVVASTVGMKGRRRILLGLFFCSGISGLLYEVAWTRMLHLLFGDTVLVVSTVLTSFMAGLALGSFWCGRRIDQRARVLGLYAALEVGIGLTALALPLALHGLTPLYVWLHQHLHTMPMLLALARFVLAFGLLLIPTTLMGATLPVLSRYLVRTNATLGWHVGVLYALNTAGAVLGCFVAGYVLIGSVGLYQTVAIGAALNLAIALLVWVMRQNAADVCTNGAGIDGGSGGTRRYGRPSTIQLQCTWCSAALLCPDLRRCPMKSCGPGRSPSSLVIRPMPLAPCSPPFCAVLR